MSKIDIVQVENWIFEHACKHSMQQVINFILSEDQNISNKHIQPIFPLLAYIDALSLWDENDYLYSDTSGLIYLVDLLRLTFHKVKSISLSVYLRTSIPLKILILMKELKDKPSSAVISTLNKYFPRWSSESTEEYKNNFNELDKRILQKIESNTKKSRNFFLDVLLSENYKIKYLNTCLHRDFSNFVSIFKQSLSKLSDRLKELLPPSAIEQIAGGGVEELCYTDDPAIQILLDYLANGTSEDNLLLLLKKLQPKVKVSTLSSQLSCRFTETPLDSNYFIDSPNERNGELESEKPESKSRLALSSTNETLNLSFNSSDSSESKSLFTTRLPLQDIGNDEERIALAL